jgi:hypothetical protein
LPRLSQGKLASARDNVIVMPTFYVGQHLETEPLRELLAG